MKKSTQPHLLKILFTLIIIVALTFAGMWVYSWYLGKVAPSVADSVETHVSTVEVSDTVGAVQQEDVVESIQAVAYFAGGCFWCTESDYEKVPGVIEAVSGYMGGTIDGPSYSQVVQGNTGHREIVKVVYDPQTVGYRRLVLELFRETDPTDAGGTFYDRGYQYTSAIYYQNDTEKQIAEAVIQELEKRNIFEKQIVTSIESVSTFWVAEKYHQDYYKKNPVQYKYYRKGSGRDAFIESVWGDGKNNDLFETTQMEEETAENNSPWNMFVKQSDEYLKETLTPLQYKVTQQEGTEKPFQNEYWDNHEEGIYVDIISGEPLFSSTDKFDSGTGWPSFLKPISKDLVTEHPDNILWYQRIEIRSTIADSHLGHIILDGPVTNDLIRYCMNSAALLFVSKDALEEEGYGAYLYLF